MNNTCGTCRHGRRSGKDGVYCTFFGMPIRSTHEGCKSHTNTTKEGKHNDESRIRILTTAAAEGRR